MMYWKANRVNWGYVGELVRNSLGPTRAFVVREASDGWELIADGVLEAFLEYLELEPIRCTTFR